LREIQKAKDVTRHLLISHLFLISMQVKKKMQFNAYVVCCLFIEQSMNTLKINRYTTINDTVSNIF
jgi:hypothetical protein